jgi:hypothetical protein
MKVNPAFVSILIIATPLAIHTPVHSYPAITLALGHSELGSYRGPHTFSKAHIVAHTPSLRCLRPLS